MTRTRQRSWLAATLLLACAAAVGLPHGATAQQYPNRDIRFICAFPPGSGADVLKLLGDNIWAFVGGLGAFTVVCWLVGWLLGRK